MTTTTTEKPVTFVKGSWQDHLSKSTTMLDKVKKDRKKASALLWQGATEGIEAWLPEANEDGSGERLYNEVLAALGEGRKGDASKIKAVAMAVRTNGLVLDGFENLSKAYAEATRLTKTVKQERDEDDAAEKAIEMIEVPKSTTTPEGAAAILLGKGIDGAVVAILDALGANNEAAHRSFMRAVSTEVAARVQAAKPKPAPKAGPKDGATEAKASAAPKATIKEGKAKAKPVSKSKGDPNAKALPPKAKAKPVQPEAKGDPVEEPVHAGDEVPDHTEVEAPPVKKAARRAVPVRRRA